MSRRYKAWRLSQDLLRKKVLLMEYGWQDGLPVGPYIREIIRHGDHRYEEVFFGFSWDQTRDPDYEPSYILQEIAKVRSPDPDYENVYGDVCLDRLNWESPALPPEVDMFEEAMDAHSYSEAKYIIDGLISKLPQGENMNSVPTSGHLQSYSLNPTAYKCLVDSLFKAWVSAEKISKREHIKANRIERVNHFITCLRREFSLQGRRWVEDFCRKEVWYDIGILAPDLHGMYNMPMSIETLQNALAAAKMLIRNAADDKSAIESDIQELSQSMHGMNALVSDMERINNESDGVLSRLVQLF